MSRAVAAVVFIACASIAFAQEPDENSKRIFGIIPNFRTSPESASTQPLTVRQKYRLATQDALDRGTIALAAIFAAEGQWTNSSPSFGQGVKGYSRYLATSWGDFAIGDYMTEAIFPELLHQDPRFFRRGTGSAMSRLRYSAGQIFLTHGDNGRTQFNYSEVLGNSAAVAIGTAYYPDNRTFGDAASRLGVQLAVDMASNVLKEFAPDIVRKLRRRREK